MIVAVRYIILIGYKIHEKLVEKAWKPKSPDAKEGVEKWLQWEKRLKEITDSDDTEPGLARDTREAHRRMIAWDSASMAMKHDGFSSIYFWSQ